MDTVFFYFVGQIVSVQTFRKLTFIIVVNKLLISLGSRSTRKAYSPFNASKLLCLDAPNLLISRALGEVPIK